MLKSVINKRVKEKFQHIRVKLYWDGGGFGGRGFFVFNVGINMTLIRHYVRYQGEQETGQAKPEF